MGWTFTHVAKGAKVSDFFSNEFNYTKEDGSYGKVVACSAKPTVAYLAYEYRKSNGESGVTAFVCLINRKKSHLNFGYKDMDESMGPNVSNCPESILNLLTPTDSKWANQWRERCRTNLKNVKKIKKDSVLHFKNEIPFGKYGKAKTFTVVDVKKNHYFAHEIGITVKLSKRYLNDNEYEIS
jgi:hypothetical protein